MGSTQALYVEEVIRQGTHVFVIAGIGAALLLTMSWCLAAGIMPRGHAANAGQQGRSNY